ncbi:nuclease-related domain-containing protein [Rhodopirellula europaea]|uniref:NERD domain-containing protein n=1 Tax=Rhodopirellula europaea SH398 TaxID=1263868 RepID=M5SM71_9BACT|nr:nuclease-related domain-containing protein [Rhodopirellula europaea]EMI27319.1 NERD domain-containing protein [Rhodopirellula europaea SH398]
MKADEDKLLLADRVPETIPATSGAVSQAGSDGQAITECVGVIDRNGRVASLVAVGAILNWLAIVVGPTLLFTLGFLPLVLCMAYWRRVQSQKTRQNPLTRSLLRSPGHSLRKKIDDLDIEVNSTLTAWLMLPAIMCIYHLSDSYFRGTPESASRIILELFVAVALSLLIGRALLRKLDELRQFRLGLEGELATGQELDQLMLEGCRVFHDIPFPYGNIDHVVVSRSGLFTVNTKMRGKPKQGEGKAEIVVDYENNEIRFPDFAWRIPNKQLETEARWLSQHLSAAMGEKIEAEPILALPGWFISNRIGRGKVFVINPVKPKRFFVQSRQVFSDTHVSQLAHHLEQLSRNVQPSFREKTGWESDL